MADLPGMALKSLASPPHKRSMTNSSKCLASTRLFRGWAIVIGVACLAGCAAGPDYKRPAIASSSDFSPRPIEPVTASAPVPGGAAQRLLKGGELQANWWELFGSPQLNALVQRALLANPTVEAAQATLRIAQEAVAAQKGFFFPTVKAGYAPSRTRAAESLSGNPPGDVGSISNAPGIYNLHTAQLTVGFVPDVFGANRRQVEGLQAQARMQEFQLEAGYLTLASNVVAAAIQEALLRQQIATTRDILAANIQSLELVRRQLKAGYASRLDLALQENALAQATQQLSPLQKQLEQNRDLLRALVGSVQDIELPESFDLASLHLPADLPVSLPSQLVEQRPDVRAAEEQLRAASAQVGVAIANRLPQFTIDASFGGTAGQVGQMFGGAGLFFNLAGGVTQAIFDAGVLRHRQAAAEEGVRQAAAQYRSTVIAAFQNVADALHAIHADAEALKAAADVERTSNSSMELIRRQWRAGYVDRLVMLTAENAHHQALLVLAQARAARLGDTAVLFQALGGGSITAWTVTGQ